MCMKCNTNREKIEKFFNEELVPANTEDRRHALASLLAVAVEKTLEELGDPFATDAVMKRMLAIAVTKQLAKKLEDPNFQREMEATRSELEQKLQADVLANMPEPKQVH